MPNNWHSVEKVSLSVMDFPPTQTFVNRKRVGVSDTHVNTYIKFQNRERDLPLDPSRRAVEWGGYWSADDGYGSSNIAIVEEIINRGWNVRPRWIPNQEGIEHCGSDKILRFRGLEMATEVSAVFAMPPDFHVISGDAKRIIAYSLWESTQLPPEWAQLTRIPDLFVTGSEFCRQVFLASGVPGPIPVIPIAISDRFQPTDRALPESGPFKFLFVSVPYQRKGLDVLLSVWGKHFANRSDVSLSIHAKRPRQRAREMSWAESEASKYPNVTYTHDTLTADGLHDLYRTHHCLVHPARGEGFGKTAAEALATAMPVIATGATGLTDFINNETAYPIDVLGWKPCNHPFYTSGHWAEPDPDSLKTHMDSVISEYSTALRRAKHGSNAVRAMFSSRVVGDAWDFVLSNAARLGNANGRREFYRDFQMFMSRLQNIPLIEDSHSQVVDDFFEGA